MAGTQREMASFGPKNLVAAVDKRRPFSDRSMEDLWSKGPSLRVKSNSWSRVVRSRWARFLIKVKRAKLYLQSRRQRRCPHPRCHPTRGHPSAGHRAEAGPFPGRSKGSMSTENPAYHLGQGRWMVVADMGLQPSPIRAAWTALRVAGAVPG